MAGALTKFREKNGNLNELEFARIVGMQSSTISKADRNDVEKMKVKTVIKMSTALGMSAGVLLDELLMLEEEVLDNLKNHVLESLEGSNYKAESDEDLMAIVELVKEDIPYTIEDGKVISGGGIWVASVIEERPPHIKDEFEGWQDEEI
ncbi:hypothetical protein [Listeria booriae]|uniref:Uncharacterized protein n=1 Tax=Listeria booriae TaxID=1552123 RepID=A0A7X0WGU8_9LIST|nr:hypothetical protein [Listeria booriae]MBC1318506.1 hypothetical protein [Listeria booriae]MBC1333522.1 hypothetical protein [Listeria booriae]MBC2388815.1 hypothetical protein [Listeria booriae]